MSKEYDSILREISEMNKNINSIDKKYSKELVQIKKLLQQLHKNVDETLDKIKQFEIILDTAEELNEEYQDEWNPYDNYESEYYEDDEDEEFD